MSPAGVKIVNIRILLAGSGAVFLVSIGAFLLFVPLLSIATVVLILIGFMLMFGLGVQVGTQETPPSQAMRHPQDTQVVQRIVKF
jgi:hypothetical protein